MTAPRPARSAVGGELRELVGLALPLCVGHLGHQLMTIVDTALLGRYGGASLAGAGLAGTLLFGVAVLGIGVLMGTDTLIPQSLGARETLRARAIFRSGVRVALAVSVPLSLVVAAIALLLPRSSVEPGVAAEASMFLWGRLPGIAPMLLFAAMRSYLQAHHITRPMVIAVVLGNLLNVAGDWILIFGDPGLEQIGLPAIGLRPLGALGASISTTLVGFLTLTVMAVSVRGLHRGQDAAGADAPAASADHARAIVRLGAPVGLQLVAEVGIFGLIAFLAGTMGRMPAAGNQIALVLASFSFSTALGIGAATSVQVGRAIGAGDTRAGRRAGALGMLTSAGVMGAAALVFLFFPGQLAALFTDERAVQEAAIPLLRIAAVFQLSDSVQAVSAGALRGVGATRFSFVANVIGHYAIATPVAILLGFTAGLGAAGLWWGLSLGLTCVALAQAIRFRALTAGHVERA